MSEFALDRCPFCGCDEISLHANYSRKSRRYFVFAQCDTCKSAGRTYCSDYEKFDESIWESVSAKDAEHAWNRRAY